MKLKVGDHLVPERPENVFRNIQKLMGDPQEYFQALEEYNVIEVKTHKGCQPIYIISGVPALFEKELEAVFGKFKVK